MSVKREKVKGELRIGKLPKDLCWGKPSDFVKKLVEILSVNLFINPGNDFVVFGFQTPSADDTGRLWIRTSRSGVFSGFYLFTGKKWERVHNYRSDEIIWVHGDSRSIPDGFQLIEEEIGGIQSDVISHIMSQYLKDFAASTTTLTVYKYFAIRYIGST